MVFIYVEKDETKWMGFRLWAQLSVWRGTARTQSVNDKFKDKHIFKWGKWVTVGETISLVSSIVY